MNIAHVFYSLSFGGIETLLINISNWQVRHDNKVTIILINNVFEKSLVEQLDKKVKVIYLGRNPGSKNPFHILRLNFTLFQFNYDIIHLHSAAITNFIFPFWKSKVILHVHDSLATKYIPKARKYIAVSLSVKKMLEIEYNLTDINVIYNAVDFDKFLKRDNYEIKNKIISIGRLKLSHKNHDGLIREFFKIKDLFDANLFIIGEGADRSYLKNLIRDLEMQDRVFLMGSKNQKWIQKNLHDYDLFVQSSHYEGFGITAIEAAAACIPLILSKVDGHIEISENGDFCDLYENKNQGELSEKILDFYKNPKIKFREASDNLLYYKKKFDLDNLNQNLMKIYKSI